MNLQRDLWNDLRLRFRRDIHREPACLRCPRNLGVSNEERLELFSDYRLLLQPTCQTVSKTVPSTHFTTATGRSPNFGRAGLPPQMRSTSALMS